MIAQRLTRRVVPVLALALLPLAAQPAFAQQTKGRAAATSSAQDVKIGVVNPARIMRESKAGQGVGTQRDTLLKRLRDQVEGEEKSLRAEQEKLKNQSTLLAKEELQKRAQEFDQKLREANVRVTTERRKVEGAFVQAMSNLEREIQKATQEVADKRGLNLVLPQSQVVMFHPSMDMTDEVLKLLNSRVTSVNFPNPDSIRPPQAQAGR